MLSNKTPYGEYGANKCYIAYLNGGFRPLHIIMKDRKLNTNNINILTNDNELLKYIEIRSKIEALFNGIAFNGLALNKKDLIVNQYKIMNT